MLLLIIVIILCIIVLFYKEEKYTNVDNAEDYDGFDFNFDISPKGKKVKGKGLLKKYLIKEQFHPDFRDTINTMNIITGKNLEYDGNIEDLTNKFIDVVNAHRNSTAIAWQSVLPETHTESGWEKQMKYLGLPPTIYNEDLKREPLKVVYTSNATPIYDKYMIDMVIKKKGVNDLMALRLTYKPIKKGYVKITDIFTLGFLTDIDG